VIPTTGTATVGGVDVIAHPALAKQVIGVVPQTNTLDRAMTVAENLEFHCRYFGMSAKAARAASTSMLERIRLAERATAPVVALSGGMAQRLMVARAILHRPQVLFLDEPTAGLDPQSRLALWDLLGELHREGQTILLTTHYMEEADKLCNRVAIMDHGRILELGTVDELVSRRFKDRAIHFDRIEALDGSLLAALPGVHRHVEEDGRVILYTGDVPQTIGALLRHAEAVGAEPSNLAVRAPSLEDVFLELTGRGLRD
jgi:ABC-2 type transport system ATP-binding protein